MSAGACAGAVSIDLLQCQLLWMQQRRLQPQLSWPQWRLWPQWPLPQFLWPQLMPRAAAIGAVAVAAAAAAAAAAACTCLDGEIETEHPSDDGQ